jgi:hypothetical protein
MPNPQQPAQVPMPVPIHDIENHNPIHNHDDPPQMPQLINNNEELSFCMRWSNRWLSIVIGITILGIYAVLYVLQ